MVRGVLKGVSLSFASGAVGALVMSLVELKFKLLGITAALGVDMTASLELSWLYPRIVEGGLWGLLFAIPLLGRSVLIRGFVYSFPPALFHLLVVLPSTPEAGMLGFGLGIFTPALVLFFFLVWGFSTAFWRRLVRV